MSVKPNFLFGFKQLQYFVMQEKTLHGVKNRLSLIKRIFVYESKLIRTILLECSKSPKTNLDQAINKCVGNSTGTYSHPIKYLLISFSLVRWVDGEHTKIEVTDLGKEVMRTTGMLHFIGNGVFHYPPFRKE
jgi:hypothetical protein